jgi:D-aminopeptidase
VRTPHLDALAAEATLFTQAFPESLPTLPVRRALHTGNRTWPFRDWVPQKGDTVRAYGWQRIPEEQITLAEILEHAGYRTGFFTDAYHQFKPSMNFHRGFAQWGWIRGHERDAYASPSRVRESDVLAVQPPLPGGRTGLNPMIRQHLANASLRRSEADYLAPQVFRAGMRWLEENTPGVTGRPYFLCLDSFDPHEPWDPPRYYTERYDPDFVPGRDGREVIAPRYGPADYLSPRELAPHPGGRRVGGHPDVDEFPAVVGDEEQDGERAEGDGGDGEEISRPDVVRVVAQERAPGLARWPRRGAPPVAPDRPIADGDPQLAQLAADPLGAPEPVLLREPADQGAHLRRHPRPPRRPPRAPPPIQSPALPVPVEHGFRLREHQMTTPVPAQAAGHHPEHPVAPPEPRAGASAQGDGELLPQQQVLEHERPAATERGAQCAEEERHPVRHATMMAHGASRHRYGVLAPFKCRPAGTRALALDRLSWGHPMKIYIMTDMEGVAEVVSSTDYCAPDSRYYEVGRELTTLETNAAIEGALEAGATDVLVVDGHGAGAINPLLLHPTARLLAGRPRPTGYPFGASDLDTAFDAAFFVGQHAKSNTDGGHLAHSNSFAVEDITINGVSVGELGRSMAIYATYGVPTVLVCGDAACCAEARALVPEVETVAVKEGLRRGSATGLDPEANTLFNGAAIHLHPERARQLIRAAATRALRRRAEISRFRLRPPFTLVSRLRPTTDEPPKVASVTGDTLLGVLRAPLRYEPVSDPGGS